MPCLFTGINECKEMCELERILPFHLRLPLHLTLWCPARERPIFNHFMKVNKVLRECS